MSGSRFYHSDDGTFRKVMPAGRGLAEATGWRSVASFISVPRLLDVLPRGDERELVYEDVFATGRCRRLLADAINPPTGGGAKSALSRPWSIRSATNC